MIRIKVVAGKKMVDHFRFAIAYWHSFGANGGDPFGPDTKNYPWLTNPDPIKKLKRKWMQRLNLLLNLVCHFYCFHDFDLVEEGSYNSESE